MQIVLETITENPTVNTLVVSFQILFSVFTVTLCFFVLLINSAFGCVGSPRASLAARQAVTLSGWQRASLCNVFLWQSTDSRAHRLQQLQLLGSELQAPRSSAQA